MLKRTILGLDVGSYAVKAAVIRAGLGGLEVLRFEESLLPQNAPPEEREAALFAFVRERQLPLELVVAALPSDRATQRHLRFPLSDARKVAQAVPFEIEEELPVPLESVVIGHDLLLSRPDQTDVLAVVATRTDVGTCLNELHLAGIEARILEMDGAALANLSSHIDLANAGRVLLDLGHRKTTLCLLVDGKPLALRAVPIAGSDLTSALARDLALEPDLAEHHKHAQGIFEPGSTKPLGPALQAELERLAHELQRSLEAVVGDPLQPIAPGEIILTGGSARLAGLDAWLSEQLGLPCSVLRGPPPDSELALLGEAGPPVFAQALGLALRGAPTGRITRIDLRQGEFAYTPDLSDLRGSLRVCGILFGLVLLLWAVSLGVRLVASERREAALRERLGVLYAETFPGAAMAEDPLEGLTDRVRETRELASHLGVSGNGLSALEVLRAISAHIPATLEVGLTELRIERLSIQARGYSKDFVSVDRMRAELATLEWVEDVRVSDVNTDPRRGGKSFNLTIRVREGA